MEVGINLKNQGPYRIKVKVSKHKNFLYLCQFEGERKSNIRFGPFRHIDRKTILQFGEDEVSHVVKCLLLEKDNKIIEIVRD